MIKKALATIFKSILLFAVFSVAITGCDSKEVNYANFIPANSSMVMSLNTEAIFSDAFFDIIANNSLTDNWAKGPLSGMIKDPANAGLQRLTKYYFFARGNDFLSLKIGGVLPVSDADQLASYIEKNFEVEVFKEGDLLIADLSNEHKLVWNGETAIYYFGGFGGDLVKEASGLLTQTNKESLGAQDSTFNYTLDNESHMSVWLKNDDVVSMIDFGLNMFGVNFMETLKIKKEDIAGAKSIFMLNFNDGNLNVVQRQYLNPVQMEIYKGFDKPNNMKQLTKMATSESAIFGASASLKTEGLLKMMKDYNLDEVWNEQMQKSPIKIKLDQLAQFFDGDGLVLLNGVERLVKLENRVTIDDEGNDVMEQVEVEKMVPNMLLGLSLKDPNKLSMLMNMFASSLPQVNGFNSFNNEYYFAVKNDLLLITNTLKGVDQLSKMENGLDTSMTSLITTHRTTVFLDFKKALATAKVLNPMLASVKAGSDLEKVTFVEKGLSEDGVVIGETNIKFANNDNSFITLMKLFGDVSTIAAPILSVYR